MTDTIPTVMTFASLDQAESALDWIGVAFADSDGCFEGELEAEDAELLSDVVADPETPAPVRELAQALLHLLLADPGGGSGRAWRVTFTA